MGQLISLGVAGQEDLFARFTYYGDRSLACEEQCRNETSTFTRRFVYNSVGFLCKQSDPFLEQEIDHTDGDYGQPAFGDGNIISRITFDWATDNWQPHDANDAMDQLGETKVLPEFCLGVLETAGCSSPASQFKNFTAGHKTPSARLQLRRLVAPAGHLRAQLRVRQPPLVGQPLQPDSFHIRTEGQMTREQPLHLCRLLAQNRYLMSSGKYEDDGQAMVKIGRSIFQFEDLKNKLDKLSTGVSVHANGHREIDADGPSLPSNL